MVALRLRNFGGMIPAVDDTLLPDTAASLSRNVWVISGALEGLRETQFLKNLNPPTRKVYRIPLTESQPFNYTNSYYMEFTDPETDVLRTPIFDDDFDRFYWTAPSTRPRYNTRARILAGNPSYALGVPAPTVAPSCTVTGGALADVTRVYVYTWVSAYGEESAPSPPLTKTGKPDGSWDLTLTAPGAPVTSDRNLEKVRIYRTVTSLTGTAVFFRVAEQVIADTTYSDTRTDAEVSADPVLDSTNFTEPPLDLKGWVQMANGVIAGWRENEIWFSEPFRPHAWPAQYTLTVEYPVVACGVLGNSLMVMTRGSPAMISGTHPENMTATKFQIFEPCMSKNSVVGIAQGIAYVSPNGLVVISPGGLTNVTQEMIDRQKWLRDYNARYIRGARLSSMYMGFGSVESGAFEPTAFENTAFEMSDYTGARTGFYLDPQNQRIGFNALQDEPVLMVFEDGWTADVLMIKQDNSLSVVSSIDEAAQRPYVWRSKLFDMEQPLNLSAAKVMFVTPPIDQVQLDEVETIGKVQTLGPGDYGLFRVYADGVHVFTKEIRKSGQVFRLPSGFKAQYWQFEVEGRITVRSIEIASTVKELAGV